MPRGVLSSRPAVVVYSCDAPRSWHCKKCWTNWRKQQIALFLTMSPIFFYCLTGVKKLFRKVVRRRTFCNWVRARFVDVGVRFLNYCAHVPCYFKYSLYFRNETNVSCWFNVFSKLKFLNLYTLKTLMLYRVSQKKVTL